MKIKRRDEGDSAIIILDGESILGDEATDFQNAVYSALEENKNKIIIDLENVNFISSWGIGILIHGYTTAINKKKKYYLAAVSDAVNKSLKATKLDTIIVQYKTVEEALAA